MQNELLQSVRAYYDPTRIASLDNDFLSFEEEMIIEEDLNLIVSGKRSNVKVGNPHNSCILYATGLTDEFNFNKARVNTIGGSPPDIDMDFGAIGRPRVVESIVERWGRENVANILTRGTFQPRSLTRRYFKIMEPQIFSEEDAYKIKEHYQFMKDNILSKIPDPIYGKEATLSEIVNGRTEIDDEGNKHVIWEAHPELASDPQYAGWYKFVSNLEGLVANFGIHPAGLIIADDPIYNYCPLWKNGTADRITSLDKDECEAVGLLKYDLLVINNLDIIQECIKLVEKRHGVTISPWEISDGDPKTFQLIQTGLLTGMFQVETSDSIKQMLIRVKPTSVDHLSIVSALHRPGPMENGFDEMFIQNRATGAIPKGMHPVIMEITKETYYCIVYQEQVMQICVDFAGFSEREADNIRRAQGKKLAKYLEIYETQFIENAVKIHGVTEGYAADVWQTLAKFSSYAFNKSHSISYAYITYACAYLKANYTVEFFTALMSVRAASMQAKKWAIKAPEYIAEAKKLGIRVLSPNVQESHTGFTISGDNIYFGLGAIKGIGSKATSSIIAARKHGKFKNIYDFFSRVSRRQVNLKVFRCLVGAGAFDYMGYLREDLLASAEDFYDYMNKSEAYSARIVEAEERRLENIEKNRLLDEQAAEEKQARAEKRKLAKLGMPIPEKISWILERKDRLKSYRQRLKADKRKPEEIFTEEELAEYNIAMSLRKKPELKLKEKPEPININRHKRIVVNVSQLIEQAELTGCYLGTHPARVVYPNHPSIASVIEGDYCDLGGIVIQVTRIKTRKGDPMMFFKFSDESGIAEAVLFPKEYAALSALKRLPKETDLVCVQGKIESTEPMTKILVQSVSFYEGD